MAKTVWIVGPPRSGTTLLYQLLTNCYGFSYFSNFTARFYSAPIIAFWLQARLIRDRVSVDYSSEYGQTDERLGPHEAGEFWYRWFPRDNDAYAPRGSLSDVQQRAFQKEIAGIKRVTGFPLLFKNIYNSARIAPILEAFPDALFIVCHRNPLDTAQSILKGRLKVYDDKNRWLSLKPKEYPHLRDTPYWEQIAGQIYYINKQIQVDRGLRVGSFLDIQYEELCNNPRKTVESIGKFLQDGGVPLDMTGTVPESFPLSTGQSVEDQDFLRLRQAIDAYWNT